MLGGQSSIQFNPALISKTKQQNSKRIFANILHFRTIAETQVQCPDPGHSMTATFQSSRQKEGSTRYSMLKKIDTFPTSFFLDSGYG